MGRPGVGVLALWLAVVLLASAVGGLAAAGLIWALGAGAVAAVGAGGATFAAVATLGIAIVALLGRA